MKLKKIFVSTLLIITVLLSNNKIYCQIKYYKGYLILINGDTLKGEIKKNPKREFENFRKATYRKGEGLPLKVYNPDKIKSYTIEGDNFISKVIDEEPVFFKSLIVGKFNLYEGQEEFLQGKEIRFDIAYYYDKTGSVNPEIINDKSNKFKKQMTELMADNKEIVKDINDEKYSFKNVVELFEAYNNSEKK